MADKYVCSRCKESGSKGMIPYKIIKDVDGMSVKFVGQLCNKCYKELFEAKDAPAPSTEEKAKEEKEE